MRGRDQNFRKALLGALAICISQPLLADGTSPGDAAAREAQAKADEAAYKAMTAAAQAKEAMYKAEVAAAQAKFGGTTGQTAIKGDVTFGAANSTALKGEGMLLSLHAARIASGKIVLALKPQLKDMSADSKKRPVMVLTSLTELATPDAIQFDFDSGKSQNLLTSAKLSFVEAKALDLDRRPDPSSEDSSRLAPVAAIGSLVSSLSNIGSFFQSDYALGEINAPALPTGLVADAVVSALKSDADTKEMKILNPSLLIVTEANAVTQKMLDLNNLYAEVTANAIVAKARHAVLAAADVKKCPKCAEVALAYQLAEANSIAAKTAFEALMTSLAAPPAAGQQPYPVRIARQQAVKKLLDSHTGSKPYVLLLAHTSTAGYITKKNLWTFLGEPPVRAMGAMAVNYSFFDPSNPGYVLLSGTVGVHGGYKTLRGVERLFVR